MSEAPKNPSRMLMVTMSAPTNIAVIKYWGKANVEFNTPINDSLSVTLDQADLRAVTTVATSPDFPKDRFWLNGQEEASTSKRLRACIDGVKALATDIFDKETGAVLATAAELQEWKVHISSYNTFPTAAGLASSAAGYAALVATLAELVHAKEEFPGQLSTLARQGSGSACRSLYGGLVAWRQGSADNDWNDSKAEQIATEWSDLKALICVVSAAQKDISSTTGMQTSVATSPLLTHRAAAIVPGRMAAMEEAVAAKDFCQFAELTMQDSNQFHACCLDTYPPIFYLNDTSRRVIRLVTAYNAYYSSQPGGSVRAAYTFDAGPNAVLYVLEPHLIELGALLLHFFPPRAGQDDYINKPEVAQRMREYELDADLLAACSAVTPASDLQRLYITQAGPGPQVLTEVCNLDAITGLNTYAPSP